jgi:hypothetical protein
MFQDITINTGHLFAGVIAAHYLCKGIDWLQNIPARRRAHKALQAMRAELAQVEAEQKELHAAAQAIIARIEGSSDFGQPTPENLEQAFRRATDHLPQPTAKPLQPDCMFMASLDPSVAVASRRRPLPGHPAPLPTVTNHGNPITL